MKKNNIQDTPKVILANTPFFSIGRESDGYYVCRLVMDAQGNIIEYQKLESDMKAISTEKFKIMVARELM